MCLNALEESLDSWLSRHCRSVSLLASLVVASSSYHMEATRNTRKYEANAVDVTDHMFTHGGTTFGIH